MTTIEKQLIAKQEEYIKFLGDQIDRFAAYLFIHGQKCSTEDFEKGKELRTEITRLKSLIPELITPTERERQSIIAFGFYLMKKSDTILLADAYDDFIQSDEYLSIPLAKDPLPSNYPIDEIAIAIGHHFFMCEDDDERAKSAGIDCAKEVMKRL